MVKSYNYYNLFSPEGKLLQVEYALEAVNNGTPVVILKSKNTIVCAYKKKLQDKLEEDDEGCIQKISKNVYLAITGIPSDVDQVVYNIKTIASSKNYSLGFESTPDIICRVFGDKLQKLTQRVGERIEAFSATMFGFDNNEPLIYYTDTSGICFSYLGIGMGEHAGRINKYLEGKYKKDIEDSEAFELALESLSASIGAEFNPSDVAVAYLRQNEPLKYLNFDEVDALLLRISEKD